MLVKVGWTKDMVDKQIPFIPISGWRGDNLLKTTDSKNVLTWIGGLATMLRLLARRFT